MTLKVRWAEKAEARNAKVLAAAIAEAGDKGYSKITREGVAQRAGVALGCVNLAFGRMDRLKTAVMDYAVKHALLEIVAQGLADGHETARNAPPSLRTRALATLK